MRERRARDPQGARRQPETQCQGYRGLRAGILRQRTNVRQDSDVDICVLCKNTFFPDYSMSQGLSDAVFNFTDAQYRYPEFKNDLESALQSYFGKNSVTRGKKAFDVHANTYRVDADVVPCFEHRRFMGTPQSNWTVYGTELLPDNGGVIINCPAATAISGAIKQADRPAADSEVTCRHSP